MLLKLHDIWEDASEIRVEKICGGKPADRLGAFPKGERVLFRMHIPRTLGVSVPVLRMAPDGGADTDYPFAFADRQGNADIYELTLDTAALCGDAASGLFFYEYLFLRGFDTRFSDSVNNVDFTLASHTARRFSLLVYEASYTVPLWFWGGTMYHVFPDRFCKGEGETRLRPGAVLNSDWENGTPQYAPKPGMPVANNEFFGGNLWGVTQKLDYLASLGVTVLYLSPVFEAATNHRYDTSDYERIDSLLGGEDAFAELIREAHARGIRVILDGVFNHTGDDSRYFNRRGTYADVGAWQSPDSPYADWYQFKKFPNEYECWWNIEIMPRLQHAKEACRRYFTGKDGIAARWIRAGIDGWRLDVADELSDEFLTEFRTAVKETSAGQGIIIGEVWENAVDKIAYGKRRAYFHGGQLDSVMNYPLRDAILAFLLEGDAEKFYNCVTELWGCYPPFVCHALMNLLGTHDTERILTRLGDEAAGDMTDNAHVATLHLSPAGRKRALSLLRMASVLQFTVFGVPSVYYGDEAGVEGYHDPFCRMPYPWGHEDRSLVAHYRRLGKLRRSHRCLADGVFRFLYHDAHTVIYLREREDDRIAVAVNRSDTPVPLREYLPGVGWKDALSGKPLPADAEVPAFGWVIGML